MALSEPGRKHPRGVGNVQRLEDLVERVDLTNDYGFPRADQAARSFADKQWEGSTSKGVRLGANDLVRLGAKDLVRLGAKDLPEVWVLARVLVSSSAQPRR